MAEQMSNMAIRNAPAPVMHDRLVKLLGLAAGQPLGVPHKRLSTQNGWTVTGVMRFRVTRYHMQ